MNNLVSEEVIDNEKGITPTAGIAKAELMMNFKRAPFEIARQSIVNFFHIYPPSAAKADVAINYGGRARNRNGRRLGSLGRRLGMTESENLETLKLAQQSMAYITQTLKRMANRQIPEKVIEWYGNNAETTRTEIKRVLNGVHSMLSFVEYKYPGSYCQPNYYAYVFPGKSYDQWGNRLDKNPQGQYIFYLCDYYFKSGTAGKIETLLHEGAHHLAMALKDSEYKGSTMYGKAACKDAAKACKNGDTASCVVALRNADTFCYFTNEAHKNPAPAPAPSPNIADVVNAGSLR